jgi:hypothetical protein
MPLVQKLIDDSHPCKEKPKGLLRTQFHFIDIVVTLMSIFWEGRSMLGFELKTACLLDKRSSTLAMPPGPFAFTLVFI